MTPTIRLNDRKKSALLRYAGSLVILLITWNNGFCSIETRENDVVKAVRKASPAVVNISSQYEIRKNSNPFSGYGMDPMLDQFFRDFFAPELERREKRTSLGSGVIIDGTRGLVLTNAHVVEKATTIRVALNDQREFEATIIGMDPDSDLAVLKIQSDQVLPAIQMGHSEDLMIGESVVAIGNPFGFSHTVTTGVVSSVNRSIKTADRVFHKFIQTDASINPGNSGGPLLNINGELIGINTAIYAQAQGIGFAIPINRAKRIISDLINFGEVVQAWIGMSVQALDSNLSNYLGVPGDVGLMVTAVETESPAATAGIDEGDIILSIDGLRITDILAYQAKMNEISAEQTLSVEISRKGKITRISIETAVFPLDRALELASQRMGIKVTDLDEQSQLTYGIKTNTGVLIIEMSRGSHLDQLGVRPGDIIRQIDEARVETLADFKAAIIKYRHKPSVILLIQRHGNLYYVNTTMKENG
ncbi:Do family serine endopeptidase [Desulfosarcina sp.]|uniref:Do family serine endopeptidase n=1 Tax=Desulfosarcina sp. TaxID=2027861 RepID=UPI0029A1994E|nr:Do family serine endopeptidase [Desulfosarcina sp.]MDX2454127.1 Do family serine endopeptidase [Desulfosarcina sp.]MDX2491809.1 Do family serine endopeptidase [Desulfosarcina sp.]